MGPLLPSVLARMQLLGFPYLSRVPAKPALHYRHLPDRSGLGNWGYAREQSNRWRRAEQSRVLDGPRQLTCLVLDACDEGLTLNVVADQVDIETPRLTNWASTVEEKKKKTPWGWRESG